MRSSTRRRSTARGAGSAGAAGPANLREYIAGLPLEWLIELVVAQADRDPRLHELLTAEARAAAGLGVDLTRWLGRIEDAFAPYDDYVGYHDVPTWAADVLRPAGTAHPAEIDIADVDGRPVVVAVITELSTTRKPCFVKTRGMDRGSFLRTHDGDRAINIHEVHVLASSHSQPFDEMALVPGATTADLDPHLIASLLRRLRATRGQLFARAGDDEILRMLGVLVEAPTGLAVTLTGLLALGRYPQQFFPQLDATFVALPTTTGEPLADGTRFLDNQSIDGPIPAMVDGALRSHATEHETSLDCRRPGTRRPLGVSRGGCQGGRRQRAHAPRQPCPVAAELQLRGLEAGASI